MKDNQSTGKEAKGSSNPIEAQGKRVHHGIEQGPIDIKGKFRAWPGVAVGGKK